METTGHFHSCIKQIINFKDFFFLSLVHYAENSNAGLSFYPCNFYLIRFTIFMSDLKLYNNSLSDSLDYA